MADEPIPSRSQPLSTNVTPALPDGVGAPGRHAIKTAPDGARGKLSVNADKETPPAHIPSWAWVLNFGAQLEVAVLLAVCVVVVLWEAGLGIRLAGGIGGILGIICTTFARTYIRWPLPKGAFEVRPSESSRREVDKAALQIPLSGWLLNLGAQFAFGLLLAVFLFVVLWATGFNPSNAGWTSVKRTSGSLPSSVTHSCSAVASSVSLWEGSFTNKRVMRLRRWGESILNQ